MAWEDLAPNQMVSFNDIQGSGISLKSGQVAINTNQCITKAEALTMYNINTLAVGPYASNQLIPKSIISYIECNPSTFVSVAQGNSFGGLAAAPNGDVYAFVSYNDIYKQTGGTGAFTPLNQTYRLWLSIAAAPNGDVYVIAEYSPATIYKQTGGTGNFIALNIPQRAYYSITVTPNGDVYVSTQYEAGGTEPGDIYKQTGGTGAFTSLNQRQQWNKLAALPNGDVYATLYQGDIYKQTGGAGDFVPQNITSERWLSFAGTTNGDVYGATIRGRIYKQTAGVGQFNVIDYSNQPNLDPSASDMNGMAITPSGNMYIADVITDNIYKASIVCDSPSGYKIRSFTSGQNIQNTPCQGDEQWFSSENFITIQLVENDGTTPKVNNTGADVVIRLYRQQSGCYNGYYIQDVIIPPGQSQTVVANTTGVEACPECTNTADTIQCYIDITPSYIEPTQEFLSYISVCPLFNCTSYTVSTTSGQGQSYTYTTCDGNQSGGNIGGAGGYDADTFCAQTGTINLIGSELNISSNGSCTI